MLHKVKLNNQCFTLLEMLLVLMIVVAVFYVMMIDLSFFNNDAYLLKEVELFGTMVENLQMIAQKKDENQKIIFDHNSYKYYDNNKLIYTHEFDKNVEISSNFKNNEININEDGNLNQGGTVMFKLDDNIIKIIFGIAEGRYRIEKD